MSPYPPRGLAWTERPAVRQLINLLAALAFLGAILLGVRGQVYINCVGRNQAADAQRTAAVAAATDAERAAQRQLIADVGTPAELAQARAQTLAAYDHTDSVRKAFPATAPAAC